MYVPGVVVSLLPPGLRYQLHYDGLFDGLFSAVFGLKLGTRAMVQARFSWGYALNIELRIYYLCHFVRFYGAMIPSVFERLLAPRVPYFERHYRRADFASVSSHLNDTAGIIVISVILSCNHFLWLQGCASVSHVYVRWKLDLTFVKYESIAWFPNLVAFVVMLGVGTKHITNIPQPPPSAKNILSFASVVVSSLISWCTMTPDYGVYHADAPRSDLLPRNLLLLLRGILVGAFGFMSIWASSFPVFVLSFTSRC